MNFMEIVNFLECNISNLDSSANETLTAVVGTARLVVRILQIAVPVALIVLGSIDIGKAVIAGDEKKMKEAQKPFIKRVIAAIIVFLIPWIVSLIIGMVGGKEWKACWSGNDQTIKNVTNTGVAPYDVNTDK